MKKLVKTQSIVCVTFLRHKISGFGLKCKSENDSVTCLKTPIKQRKKQVTQHLTPDFTSSAFIKIAVKPRPSGRGCKAVTRKPPQGACLVSLMVTERSRSTELGLGKLFAKKED